MKVQLHFGDINGLHVKPLDDSSCFEPDSVFMGLRIEDIIEDRKGRLILATKGKGLAVFEPVTREVTYIDVSLGLVDNYIEDIEYQEEHIYWVATLKGISRVDLQHLDAPVVKNYTMSHGLPVPDVYDLSWNKGILYAATGQGVIKVEGNRSEYPSKSPRIKNLKVNTESRSILDSYSLDYDENDISIEYQTINLAHASDQRYRYRMNDKDWTVSSQSELLLTNLSAGTYHVSIQSENEDGIWSPSTKVVIKVNETWWNTWWFYLLIAAAVSTSIYFWHRVLVLEKESANKDERRTLKKAALQSQMNPHFIFNSLNSIQNFIMTNDKLAAMDYLGRFAKLIRLTLNASAEETITLHDEVQMLHHYLALEKLRFKSKFDYKIITADDINLHGVFLPPMLIQPLVVNTVKHGISGMKVGGLIEVYVAQSDSRLHITVRDNGAAIADSTLTSDSGKKSQDEHRSSGMSITGKRLSMSAEIKIKRVDGWSEVEVWV